MAGSEITEEKHPKQAALPSAAAEPVTDNRKHYGQERRRPGKHFTIKQLCRPLLKSEL